MRHALRLTHVLLALGVGVANYAVFKAWPSCGPMFTVSEQLYKNETVFWLRKRVGDPWPLCTYRLDSPALFYTVEGAKEAARSRLARTADSEERVVATVP